MNERYVIGIYGADLWYVSDLGSDKLVKDSGGTRDNAEKIAKFMNEAQDRSGADELREALEAIGEELESGDEVSAWQIWNHSGRAALAKQPSKEGER